MRRRGTHLEAVLAPAVGQQQLCEGGGQEIPLGTPEPQRRLHSIIQRQFPTRTRTRTRCQLQPRGRAQPERSYPLRDEPQDVVLYSGDEKNDGIK